MNLTKEEKDIILGHLVMSELYAQRDIKSFEFALEDERRQSKHDILYNKRHLKLNKKYLITLQSLIKKFNCSETQNEK
jgi:hypothetical protein